MGDRLQISAQNAREVQHSKGSLFHVFQCVMNASIRLIFESTANCEKTIQKSTQNLSNDNKNKHIQSSTRKRDLPKREASLRGIFAPRSNPILYYVTSKRESLPWTSL